MVSIFLKGYGIRNRKLKKVRQYNVQKNKYKNTNKYNNIHMEK